MTIDLSELNDALQWIRPVFEKFPDGLCRQKWSKAEAPAFLMVDGDKCFATSHFTVSLRGVGLSTDSQFYETCDIEQSRTCPAGPSVRLPGLLVVPLTWDKSLPPWTLIRVSSLKAALSMTCSGRPVSSGIATGIIHFQKRLGRQLFRNLRGLWAASKAGLRTAGPQVIERAFGCGSSRLRRLSLSLSTIFLMANMLRPNPQL